MEETRLSENRSSASPAGRWLLTLLGLLCVALGVVGVILPLLPTTPFLLLAAACFSRASPKLKRWLYGNRLFGDHLRRYRRGEGIPGAAKFWILVSLWLSLAASAWFVVPPTLWPAHVALGLIGLGVSLHVLRSASRIGQPVTNKRRRTARPAPRDPG